MNYRGYTILALLLSSCIGANRGRDLTSEAQRPRPIKSTIATTSDVVERDFAGLSTPTMSVNLAFKISGQVARVPVYKGLEVERGDLLCSLDPRDVELQLIADRSAYESAKSSYERARRLLEHEAISQQEVERSESSYLTTKSIYDNTLETLQETTIVAPFAAVVERVYVDTYQRIQSGETVVRIVAPTTSQVEFTLPESSLTAIQDSTTRFRVSFDNIPNVSFDAKVSEYARTSSDASGFPVTLQFQNPNPRAYSISSGMSCNITMLTKSRDQGAVILPLTAIYSPTAGGTYVWVVGVDSRVTLRKVDVERLSGSDYIVVRSGVRSGEDVVTAGVYQLREGEQVKSIK